MPLPADLGIVVVNYGSSALLEENLVPLARLVRGDQVVVVDNFSGISERAATTALARREGWALIAPALNLGFGAGVNMGARHLIDRGCQRLLLLNPDARIDETGVALLAAASVADPASIQCPRIVRSDGRIWFAGGTVDVAAGRTRVGHGPADSDPNGWLTGACLMVPAALWRWLNGFDERYFLYWEDVDLSWRCTAAGGSLVVRDDVTAVHSVGGTQDGAGKSALYVYFNCRNRLLFAAAHLGRRDLLRWLVFSPGYAALVLQRGGRRNLLRRLGPLLVAAVRGTSSGAAQAVRSRFLGRGRPYPAQPHPLQPAREPS
jgi:GT2 family glycosyltransferase